MAEETIRHSLVEALNDIAKLTYLTDNEYILDRLNSQYNQLYAQLNEIIKADLANAFGQPVYLEAIESLNDLIGEAKDAADQINRTAQVIQKAANAIGKVAQVLAFLASVAK